MKKEDDFRTEIEQRKLTKRIYTSIAHRLTHILTHTFEY